MTHHDQPSPSTHLTPESVRQSAFFQNDQPSSDEQSKGSKRQKNQKGNPTPGKPGAPGAPTPPNRGMFGMIMVVLVVVTLFMLFNNNSAGERITLQQFETYYNNGDIVEDSVEIRDDSIVSMRKADPGGNESRVVIYLNVPSAEAITKAVIEITGGNVKSRPSSRWLPFVWAFGPFILLLLLIWFFVGRAMRSAGAGGGMLGNFGKSRHRVMSKEMTGVTFKDVAGIDEAKDEVAEIIEFLKSPKRFTRLGGRIPRGVLLTGPPGCGKTLLAKAIAGEADVPFFTISGSDFVEMFVGVGASRVRDLFKQAKESAPCIIFLDEVDAVGRRRGGGFTTGGHDEREQTLNAILVEMDGFQPADGVIVVAATNRPDVLDSALIRPGRFDRQVAVTLPDVLGRHEILKVHSKKVKLGPNVDLKRLAKITPMFSGADLAAIINEGAIAATMTDKEFIEQEDLEEARDKIRFGRARKSRRQEDDDKTRTAYHEAGHAVLQALLTDADPLHKVTIIPRGQALGATFSMPEKDRTGMSLRWIIATMRVLCAGRIAQQRGMGDIDSGASSDIAYITDLARHMILEWGMSDRLGFVRYASDESKESLIADKEYSDETARIIDEEVKRLIDEAYHDAEKLLDENWERVESITQALIKHETLDTDEVNQLLRGETLDKPTISDLLTAESQKTTTPPSESGQDSEADENPDAAPEGPLPNPA